MSDSVGMAVFFKRGVSLQESLRGRPKEIPHNEKLLSLKYEVKLLDSSAAAGSQLTAECQGYISVKNPLKTSHG